MEATVSPYIKETLRCTHNGQIIDRTMEMSAVTRVHFGMITATVALRRDKISEILQEIACSQIEQSSKCAWQFGSTRRHGCTTNQNSARSSELSRCIAPVVWNALPVYLRSASIIQSWVESSTKPTTSSENILFNSVLYLLTYLCPRSHVVMRLNRQS